MSLLFDRTYGCLLGGIIGDAMGAPTEGKTYEQIQKKFGEVTDFEGTGTDDTAIKHILCQALVEGGGHVNCDSFADAFLKNEDKYDLFYIPVKNMFHKIRDGVCVPLAAGYGNQTSVKTGHSRDLTRKLNAPGERILWGR